MSTISDSHIDFLEPALLETRRKLRSVVIEFLALTGLLVGVVLAVMIDLKLLKNSVSEASLTEALQAVLVLASALIFIWRAMREVEARGYLIGLATLFTCMFIRENDAYLDQVYHGFWAVPVGIAAVAGAVLIGRYKATLVEPLTSQIEERHSTFMFMGLLIVLVFSRLFGTGALWQAAVGAEYNAIFKTIVQEGLELLGYALIVFGSVLSLTYCRFERRHPEANPTNGIAASI
ncbi:hypothetical protein [Tritonibacter scottomollicae]|uniref:hypothetical protein n=1 Tax=Tritonibacter scottomollicae TaxID=483013 RepID=UPI003AA8AF0E